MRLICPNCGARYDVADDVIPKGGRDVQCSNCTKTWFQTDVQQQEVETSRENSLITPAPASSGRTVEIGAPADPAKRAAAPEEEAPRKRPLDSAVANILREEAAHGNKAAPPAAERPPATEQAKSAGPVDQNETRKRIAIMTKEEGGTTSSRAAIAAAATGAVADADANLRSIPDIQEINAALRARAEAADTSGLNAAEKAEARERRGFRRGFFLVLILVAILIAPYFFVDQITEALPQTRPFMAEYVLVVEQARVWLDQQFATISELIQGFTAG